MDTEHSYYARVLDEVERLQPVGAGGGIPGIESHVSLFRAWGAGRHGICRCVPAKTRFPWGRGRSVDRTRTGISTVRCARPAARSPVAVFLWWPLSTGSMESLD